VAYAVPRKSRPPTSSSGIAERSERSPYDAAVERAPSCAAPIDRGGEATRSRGTHTTSDGVSQATGLRSAIGLSGIAAEEMRLEGKQEPRAGSGHWRATNKMRRMALYATHLIEPTPLRELT
jgi:hypothetical protein